MKKFEKVLAIVNYVEANKDASMAMVSMETGIPLSEVVEIVDRLISIDYLPKKKTPWWKDGEIWVRLSWAITLIFMIVILGSYFVQIIKSL